MDPDKEEILRRNQMTFIGKALACFPQGMRNHLAAVRESSAVMSGLLEQSDRLSEEDRKQFTGILSTIENQVSILTQKSQYLDRFAQRMHKAFPSIQPEEVVEEAVSFSSRFARLRQASLRLDAEETLPSLYIDPLLIYFTVSIMINDMLERVKRGGEVIVRAGRKDNGVLIDVEGQGIKDTGAPPEEEAGQYWSAGLKTAEDLGGRLETSATEQDLRRTSLFIPIKKEL